MIKTQRYGWRKDLVRKDIRDFVFSAPRRLGTELPNEVDWRNTPEAMPPIRDQDGVGSCTGYSTAGAHEFLQRKEGPSTVFTPSPFFNYYNARDLEGTTNQDAGASIRDVVDGLVHKGTVPESLWPSNDPTRVTSKPFSDIYEEGLKHQILQYQSVPQNLDQMRACIAARYPLCFGITIHKSFESSIVKETGVVSMPGWRFFDPVQGGHALWACGYSMERKYFIVPNSWSTNWGDKGYCYIPFDYMLDRNLCSDLWMLMLVEEEDVTI